MNVLRVYHSLSDSARREVEGVLLRELGSLSAAVARECNSADGELHLNLLRDLSAAASTYRTLLQVAHRQLSRELEAPPSAIKVR